MEKITSFVGENAGEALKEFVRLLNEGFDKTHPRAPEAQSNLIQLLQSWQQAQAAPAHRTAEVITKSGSPRTIRAPLPTLLTMKFPTGCPGRTEIENRLKLVPGYAGTGTYYTANYVGEKGKPWTAWDDALQMFMRFINDPQRDSFSGPCPRCKKYFIRKTAKRSIYCSRRHASQETAIKATIRARQEQHEVKIAVAKEAISEWKTLASKGRTKKDWKEWVVGYKPKTEITIRFLTRAVNNGELQPPQAIKERNQ